MKIRAYFAGMLSQIKKYLCHVTVILSYNRITHVKRCVTALFVTAARLTQDRPQYIREAYVLQRIY